MHGEDNVIILKVVGLDEIRIKWWGLSVAGLHYRMILFGPIHQVLSRLSVHKTAAGDSERDTKS